MSQRFLYTTDDLFSGQCKTIGSADKYGMRYFEIVSESELANGGVVKTKKPLTTAQLVKRNDRLRKLQQDIRDEQTKSAMRLNKLWFKVQDL